MDFFEVWMTVIQYASVRHWLQSVLTSKLNNLSSSRS